VFRLDETADDGKVNLTIDGELSADCVELLETRCEAAVANGEPINLILRDVPIVDEAGRALLRRLAAKGVRLLGNGVYVSYLVESVKSAGNA
jgi:ABC-type transporter Mla MlaB component